MPDIQTLHLALPEGANYGWGLCGTYLRKELRKQVRIEELTAQTPSPVDGVVFGALEGVSLKPWLPVKGQRNIGYVFFENELDETSAEHAKESDLILCGSTWCRDRLVEKGISHADVLLQGIDPEIFYPCEPVKEEGTYTIFSGGKFELRKGQDVVLKAFGLLQDKYPDMRLVTAWENPWPQSVQTMSASPYLRFEMEGGSWREQIHYLCVVNGVDPRRVQVCPLISQAKMRGVMARSSLGVFPNRCEGGTNLVLMEYMACGRPAVVSDTSGHRDVAAEDNAFLLKDLEPFQLNGANGQPLFRWEQAVPEQLAEAIEYAYHHREDACCRAGRAGERMKALTWEVMAKKVLEQYV